MKVELCREKTAARDRNYYRQHHVVIAKIVIQHAPRLILARIDNTRILL